MAAEFFIQAVAGQPGVLPRTGGEKVIGSPWGRGLRCLRETLTHFTQPRRRLEERPSASLVAAGVRYYSPTSKHLRALRNPDFLSALNTMN